MLLRFDPEKMQIQVAEPLKYAEKFWCLLSFGIMYYQEGILASFGIDDNKAHFGYMTWSFIEKIFTDM